MNKPDAKPNNVLGGEDHNPPTPEEQQEWWAAIEAFNQMTDG